MLGIEEYRAGLPEKKKLAEKEEERRPEKEESLRGKKTVVKSLGPTAHRPALNSARHLLFRKEEKKKSTPKPTGSHFGNRDVNEEREAK